MQRLLASASPLSMKLVTLSIASLFLSAFLCAVDSWRRRRRRRCFRDCVLGDWQPWSTCTKSCTTGTQHRTRGIAVAAECSGKTCTGALSETKYCNTQCCPVNCVWSWNAWSPPCSGCGIFTQKRALVITQNPSCSGVACPTTRTQTRSCNTGV